MSLERPEPGAPWDKRMDEATLTALLQRGPRAFEEGRDVDLLDWIEQTVAERCAVPVTVAGLRYAPGVANVDLSGPAWPLATLGGTIIEASGHAVLTGAGMYRAARPIGPLPAGRQCAAVLEFRVDAAQDAAWAVYLGALDGTTDQPAARLTGYPVSIGRGWAQAFPAHYTGGPASDPLLIGSGADLADVQVVQGGNATAGGAQVQALPVRGALRLGRWYRAELLPGTGPRDPGRYGDQGVGTLYDAETGETILSCPQLYTLAAPQLGVMIGTPEYSAPAPGFTAGPVSVTVRRWMEWR